MRGELSQHLAEWSILALLLYGHKDPSLEDSGLDRLDACINELIGLDPGIL